MNKEAMLELLKKKKREGKELSEPEKKAKLGVLGDIHSMAKNMMSDNMKGLKKVTVASPSQEGLKEGLEKAREIVGHTQMAPEMEEAMGGESEEEETPEHEAAESPEEEKAEHSCECEGKGCEKCSEMSEEEIDAEINRLMEMKRSKSKEE